jgi:hypothetical protein
VERLLKEKEMTGVISGFMFLRKDAKNALAADFEEALVERLEWIQQNTTGIIPVTIDLWAEFGVSISMRRGATTEALNAGIDGPTIDANNGWWKIESAKGKMPRFSMRQRYTQIFQDLKHQLKFYLGIWVGTEGGFRIRRGQFSSLGDVASIPCEIESRVVISRGSQHIAGRDSKHTSNV